MVGFLAVFLAGVATLATPCVLPLVPIFLAVLLGGSVEAVADTRQRARLLRMTFAFALGFSAVFTALGLGASFVAGFINEQRELLSLVSAVVILLLGLQFLDLLKFPGLGRTLQLQGPRRVGSMLGGFAFGVVFGLGWTPCAGPVLAAVLSYAAMDEDPGRAGGLLLTYSAGLALPLLIVSGFADRTLPWLRRRLGQLAGIQKVTGALMILIGLGLGIDAGVGMARYDPQLLALTEAGIRLDPILGRPSTKPRLIELVEEDCPVCQRMAVHIATLEGECKDQQVEIHAVNLSADANRSLRRALGVTAVPTILLVDDLGRVQHRVVGERTADELRGLAADLLASSCAGVDPLDVGMLSTGAACGEDVASVSEGGECG